MDPERVENSPSSNESKHETAWAGTRFNPDEFAARALSQKELAEANERGNVDRQRYARALAASVNQSICSGYHFDCAHRPDLDGAMVHPDGVPRRYSRAEFAEGWCEIREEIGRAVYTVLMAGPDKDLNRRMSKTYSRAELELLVEKHFDSAATIVEQRDRFRQRFQKLPDDELLKDWPELLGGEDLPDLLIFGGDQLESQAAKLFAFTEELSSRMDRLAQGALADKGEIARIFLVKHSRAAMAAASWRHPIEKIKAGISILTCLLGPESVIKHRWERLVHSIRQDQQQSSVFALKILHIRHLLSEDRFERQPQK